MDYNGDTWLQVAWVGDTPSTTRHRTVSPNPWFPVEERFTYRRFRRPDGSEGYERVPYDPNAPVIEPPVIMPQPREQKNGELPGQGSAAVEAILERIRAADTARLVREIDERADANGPVRASPSPQEERSYEPKRKIEV